MFFWELLNNHPTVVFAYRSVMDFYGKAALWPYFKILEDLLFGFSLDQIFNELLPVFFVGFQVPCGPQCGIDIRSIGNI